MSMEKDFAFLAGEYDEDNLKQECYVCGKKTYRICSICKKPICKKHTKRLKQHNFQERCIDCNR